VKSGGNPWPIPEKRRRGRKSSPGIQAYQKMPVLASLAAEFFSVMV